MPHHSYSLLFVNLKVPLVKVLELGVPTKVSLKGPPPSTGKAPPITPPPISSAKRLPGSTYQKAVRPDA